MSVATLKAAALAIFTGAASWCQGANARDAGGKPCPILSPDAVAWDLYGACYKAARAGGNTNYTDLHGLLSEVTGDITPGFRSRDLESWNDHGDTNYSSITTILS